MGHRNKHEASDCDFLTPRAAEHSFSWDSRPILGALGLQRLATYDETINDVRKSADERYLEERKLALDQYRDMTENVEAQFSDFRDGLEVIAQDVMERVISEKVMEIENKQETFLQQTNVAIETIAQDLEPFQWLKQYKDRPASLSLSGIQTINMAYERASELLSEGNPDAALAVANFAVQNSIPGDASHYFNFSTLLSQHDQAPAAADVVDIGLRHYPENVDLIAQGIHTNKSAGRHDRAEELLVLLEDIPKEHWPWRAFVFSGEFLIETGRINRGLFTYNEFREYIPGDERGYSLPGDYLSAKGRYEDALQILEQGSKRIRWSAQTNLTLSQIYIRAGKYEDAVVAASRALEANAESQPNVSQAGVLWIRATALDSLIHKELEPVFDTAGKSVDMDLILNYVRSCVSDYRLSMIMSDGTRRYVVRGNERIRILRGLVERMGVSTESIEEIFHEGGNVEALLPY